jgi:transcriptional regulator with XRE-family HTH domain
MPKPLPGLVGAFLKRKREERGLSQRALGQLLTPPCTTQFISNIERGVTTLPPTHVPHLAAALGFKSAELMRVLKEEFGHRVAGKAGQTEAAETLSREVLAIAQKLEELSEPTRRELIEKVDALLLAATPSKKTSA